MLLEEYRQSETPWDSMAMQMATFLPYLQALLAVSDMVEERFHAVFLDGDRGYLDDGELGQGNVSNMAIRMRDLFARALALGARGLIIAHNHPSGDCRPSQHDLDATRRLAEIASALDIELIDHLIFTREKVYSMRAGGKL